MSDGPFAIEAAVRAGNARFKERRERIATAVLAGIAASNRTDLRGPDALMAANVAVKAADALIAKLDE